MKESRKRIPKSLQNMEKWNMKRRNFFKTLLAASLAAQIPWWLACSNKDHRGAAFILDSNQMGIIKKVQEFLFPSDGKGPGAADLKAHQYLQWVLNDQRMDPEEKDYLLNGIAWVEETAFEEMGDSFLHLEADRQDNLLVHITKEDWGESWCSIMLSLIFEALLSDPIYGSNVDGMGWKWLEHNPGIPRPTNEMKYGHFTNYIKQQNRS